MTKPLFIKIENHNDIKKVLEEIRQKLLDTKSKIERLKELKDKEAEYINNWGNDTEDIDEKLKEIERILQTSE